MKTIAEKLAEQAFKELSMPEKPMAKSRVWQDPQGYRYLVQWSNTVLLRFLVRKLTDNLPKSEYRRKAQLDDAARSVVRNIEEGYKRATTSEYIQFLGYSQASLEEVKGDIRELTEDGFLADRPGSNLVNLGINLGNFNKALLGTKGSYRKLKEVKGNTSSNILYRPLLSSKEPVQESPGAYQHLTVLYPPLKAIHPQDLTYEIFMELINKTDYLLRRLVISLEKKLVANQKAWQIEKARVRGNLRWQR